jgi:dihydroorotase
LRRILPILSFILLIATHSQGQSSRTLPASETNDRIVKLYPNPATTNITFDLQKGLQQGMSVQLFSFMGKKVMDVPVTGQKTNVNLTDFNRGLYMYHLLDATGKVIESGKFQVSK